MGIKISIYQLVPVTNYIQLFVKQLSFYHIIIGIKVIIIYENNAYKNVIVYKKKRKLNQYLYSVPY